MKKILVAVTGGILLVVGVAMIVLPGPAFLVIPAGLAVLALEFDWARRWLDRVNQRVKSFAERRRARRAQSREAGGQA